MKAQGKNICGLFDCCIETVRRFVEPVNEGDVLDCEWCGTSMVLHDGAWELKEREAA